jgi:hypothetical protein
VGFYRNYFVDRRDAKCSTNVIIGKIIGLLAVEKSASSEGSTLTEVYYIRNLPIFQQPISNKTMIFPMMTLLSSILHPAYRPNNFDKNPLFIHKI